MRPTRRARLTAVATLLLLPVALSAAPAALAAGTPQSKVVGSVPQLTTPVISDGAVYAVTQVGSTIVVGGSFTKTDAQDGSGTSLSTPYVLAFDAATGALQRSFAPVLAGGSPGTAVQTLLPGPTPGTVYVGGIFTSVNGVTSKGITLLNVADGSRVTTFKSPQLDFSNVQTVKRLGDRLFVGGAFTKVNTVAHGGVATLNAATGALDPFMGSTVQTNHSWTTSSPTTAAKAAVGVYRLDITPDGSTMVGIGNFKTVDGTSHDQVVQWDLTGPSATLRPWGTSRYQALCNTAAYDSYVRDVAFSPDGSYFVISSTGGYGPAGSLCDTAARFETGSTASDAAPTWVNATGKDTLLSVAVTGTAVYVGGHQRWLNNSAGADAPGPGAVPRPGVGALDPATGLPMAWNPGRAPRGAGTWTLFATPDGLWMGSDTDYVGNYRYRRGKLAFFPLSSGAPAAGKAVPTLPADVVVGSVPAAGPTGVLARLNAGGPLLRSTDAGPDWLADNTSSTTYHNAGSSVTSYASPPTFVDSTVPPGTPQGLFATERFDPGTKGDGGEMQWRIPGIAAGTQVDVRLYFANRAAATQGVGKRTFDVSVDGALKLNDLDISATAGDQTATMKSIPVTSDGTIDIAFGHEVNNPVLSGIEVVRAGTGPFPLPAGSLATRTFTGTTAGAAGPVAASNGFDPSLVHGAMVVGGQLFYGGADGNLHKRSVAGGTWGDDVLVDPYNDPAWVNVQTGSGQTYRGTKPNYFTRLTNVTSMSYDGVGRMYYTLYGSTGLFTRTFSPDSGVMGTDETQVPGTLPAGVTGAFLSGSTFYVATSDGQLRAQAFGGLSGLSGTATVVSGPAKDGVSWNSPVLFLAAGNAPPAAAAAVRCTDLRCTADGTASSDSDGSIGSYAWEWGDGATSTGATATHEYAAGGTYPVTLTVTDNAGATGSGTQQVTVSPHVNSAPTAAFTSSCLLLRCTYDGRGSDDADGAVTAYAWEFGDGDTATGPTATHDYAAAGTYRVALTVTDDAGAQSTSTQQVTVTARPASSIAFRGSGTLTSASATLLKVPVPASVRAGDALLLKVATAGTGAAPTPPAGWTELDRQAFAGSTALQVVWQRAATDQDAGTTVAVQLASAVKSTSQLLAYSGAGTATAVSTVEGAVTSRHTAPAVTVTTPGSWVVWSWTDKSSSTTGWTLPDGTTTRATGAGTGSGYLTTAVGDQGSWPVGDVPGQTATTVSAGGTATRGVLTSLVLPPAS